MDGERVIGELKIDHLERLPEPARALPVSAFDRAVEVHYINSSERPTMRLVLACSAEPFRDWRLVLVLRDLQSVLFPPIGPHLWLPQLEIIENRASNFDGSRILVSAEEGSGFECYCGSIECESFTAP